MHVLCGVIGEQLLKRCKGTFSTGALRILNVQLCVYRAAFNFYVDLPMTEEALDDTKYSQANNVLGILGLAVFSKKEVLDKGFPPVVLTGDTRDWYSNGILPRLAREAADVLSFFTLPYGAGAYPNDFFSGGGLGSSRYAVLEDNEGSKPDFDKAERCRSC